MRELFTDSKIEFILHPLKVFAAGIAGSLLLRTINWTLRWQRLGFEGENQNWPSSKPRIIAFWHGHQLFMPWSYIPFALKASKRPFVALISQSPDGRMIARAMKFLGITSVAGSSSRRSSASMYELIDKLKKGSHIAITPDGPKGPARLIKGGIIRIAQKSGAPIYPAAIAAEKKWNFKSWDRMLLPEPFSRAVLIMGEPVLIPPSLSADELKHYSKLVQDSLDKVSKQAEEYNYNKPAADIT